MWSFVYNNGLFDAQRKDEDYANDEYWHPWEVIKDLFDCMWLYYKDANADNVKYYELGGDFVSNEEE